MDILGCTAAPLLFAAIMGEFNGGHSLNTAAPISAVLLYIIIIKDALSRLCSTVCLCEGEIVEGADVTFQNLKKTLGHGFFLCRSTTMKAGFSSQPTQKQPVALGSPMEAKARKSAFFLVNNFILGIQLNCDEDNLPQGFECY